MSASEGPRRRLRHLLPSMPFQGGAEAARASFGALIGIGLAGLVAQALGRGDLGLAMIAPFGASAVLLFAVPNSPLAQPWSANAGNAISALAGVAAVLWVPDPVLRMALAVALAILAMHLIRALHPPGGAVALTAALNPDAITAQGFGFALAPVLAGTLFLTVMAVGFARLTGRHYPFRQPEDVNNHGTTDSPALDRIGITRAELAGLLREFRLSSNIGVEDLARLIGAAELLAAQHQVDGVAAADIMSRDLVTVGPDAPLAEVAEIFRTRGFTSLPVVGPDMRFLGVIFQIHLIRHGREEADRSARSLGAALRLLTVPGRPPAQTATAIMATTGPRATADTPLSVLLPLLADGDCEAVPILDGDRLIGIVTRTDLIAALALRQG